MLPSIPFIAILAALLCLHGVVTASKLYPVDLNDVYLREEAAWCKSHIGVCTELCHKSSQRGSSDCKPDDLSWSCECANSPISSRVLQRYKGIIPYHECAAYIQQCVRKNANNASARENCLRKRCGGVKTSEIIQVRTISPSGTTPGGSPNAPPGTVENMKIPNSKTPNPTRASSTATSRPSSNGLSEDAKIGIGAGAVVVGFSILIGVSALGYFAGKRRARFGRDKAGMKDGHSSTTSVSEDVPKPYELDGEKGPYELAEETGPYGMVDDESKRYVLSVTL